MRIIGLATDNASVRVTLTRGGEPIDSVDVGFQEISVTTQTVCSWPICEIRDRPLFGV